ncbi:N-formylglutamate amidohydrolase [Christiangramia sabulilitoris]|uniref:N-formylglutamate amidohydrolase n=1 Tax=Christiangramia sabulilitoris TaxID=2583991 RepID=A0A550I6C8_9FLAO|nr:N-formylglutamate amidohydrolase [Christiangramia sabulilitoris]TRO66526.1 N-formylglutamate amidohydrolase [Christiangramia sabulilitoris]
MTLIITSEHAFPDIPEKYSSLFINDPDVLKTHEAFDPGSFNLFEKIGELADYKYHQKIGRLLIESNRSVWHKSLFSRYSKHLSPPEKKSIIETYYNAYRDEVISAIDSCIKNGGSVFHLSVHSFTPVLNNIVRNADIGLLYDPQRFTEKKLARDWKKLMLSYKPGLNVRYNYPYLGKADGFTTALRKRHSSGYIGIELEVNQKWVSNNKMHPDITNLIYHSLEEIKKRPEYY